MYPLNSLFCFLHSPDNHFLYFDKNILMCFSINLQAKFNSNIYSKNPIINWKIWGISELFAYHSLIQASIKMPLVFFFFLSFVLFGGSTWWCSWLCTQEFLLAVLRGPIWVAGGQIWLRHMQGKCLGCCIISPTPRFSIFERVTLSGAQGLNPVVNLALFLVVLKRPFLFWKLNLWLLHTKYAL